MLCEVLEVLDDLECLDSLLLNIGHVFVVFPQILMSFLVDGHQEAAVLLLHFQLVSLYLKRDLGLFFI